MPFGILMTMIIYMPFLWIVCMTPNGSSIFFANNKKDLEYFHVDINQAVEDTFEDLDAIEDFIYDEDDIDSFFQNLSLNYCESVLQKKKGKLYRQKHQSWVRLYAIKLEPNIYVITGGAIKLTEKMQDRDHTLRELMNLEKCRNFLIEHGVIDNDSLIDSQNENKQAQWIQLKN